MPFVMPNVNETEDFNKYFKELEAYQNVSEKMQKLYELLSLKTKDLKIRQDIADNIQKRLRPYYPDCIVSIYGSSANSFGVAGCDIDLLLLPFPDYCNVDAEDNSPSPPRLWRIWKGKDSREQLKNFTEELHLKFVKIVLMKCEKAFEGVSYIPAKCPIVNFIYKDHGIICDLSCSNRLVLHNTDLLHLYGKIDHRVQAFVVTLRCWAKSLKLMKQGSFSSYAFTFLIIFFLQNVEPKVVPSVKYLNELSGSSRVVAGWECAFTEDLKRIPVSKNTDTMEELLGKFLNYYLHYDFSRNIISPFTGKSIPTNELKEDADERLHSFEISSVCIQDPFMLSHNVSRNVKYENLVAFKTALFIADRYLLELFNSGSADLFQRLFDPEEYKKTKESLFLIQYPEHLHSFSIHYNFDVLQKVYNSNYFEQLWCNMASQAVLDVLQYGLWIECEVVDKAVVDIDITQLSASEVEPRRVSESNFESHDLKLLLSIQCAAFSRTWFNRKSIVETDLEENESSEITNAALKEEYNISRCLLEKNPYFTSPEPILWFMCDCYRHSLINILDVVVILTPLTKSKEFTSVSVFLKSFVPKTVSKMFNINNSSENIN